MLEKKGSKKRLRGLKWKTASNGSEPNLQLEVGIITT